MAVAVSRMSAAEYLATSEDRPERTELINGTVALNEAKIPHQRALLLIVYEVHAWIEEGRGRGYVSLPTDMPIDDANVFAPDAWWVAEDRRPVAGQLDLDGLPDLVVEIRSPSTWAMDLGVKLPAYEQAGVSEAWYVDTKARTVLVFRRSGPTSTTFDSTAELGEDEDLTSPLLPGFNLGVSAIFANGR